MPEVAVILPVFNAADTLDRCLESLCQQSFEDIRLVAVDDGSQDASPRKLTEWSRADDRIVLVRHDRNLGICAALNRGMGVAGDASYIARMDADDWSHPERLRLQVDALERRPDLGLIGTQVAFGGDRRTQEGYAAYVDWTNQLVEPEEIALNRFVESPFAHPSVMFRTHLVAQHGGYRAGPFPEDYELWLRWLDAGVRMGKVRRELLTWYDPPERLSRTDSRYARQAFYECKAVYLARWLRRHNPCAPRIVVWGAGRTTRKRADLLLRHGVTITHYVDVDPRKIGQCIHGRVVWSEHDLPEPGHCFVVSYVGSRGARDDIRTRLGARGYREGEHFVVAA